MDVGVSRRARELRQTLYHSQRAEGNKGREKERRREIGTSVLWTVIVPFLRLEHLCIHYGLVVHHNPLALVGSTRLSSSVCQRLSLVLLVLPLWRTPSGSPS
ncbi:hypothetical protein Mapa_016107 [Marchantia paleacea]|nr:hypothetical protein Mapa_016107 [Marchantia paleacea]